MVKKEYIKVYKKILTDNHLGDAQAGVEAFVRHLEEMYASEKYKEHNIYPSMNVESIYAVIAMCLELKHFGMSDKEIIDAVDRGFESKRAAFKKLLNCIDLLPCCYSIARKWNINDHAKRVEDGSIDYDYFNLSDDKVEYSLSGCRYIDMFETYGIRPLCKIYCMTDEMAYASLTRHVKFIRHSDMSDSDVCHDEVIRKRRSK